MLWNILDMINVVDFTRTSWAWLTAGTCGVTSVVIIRRYPVVLHINGVPPEAFSNPDHPDQLDQQAHGEESGCDSGHQAGHDQGDPASRELVAVVIGQFIASRYRTVLKNHRCYPLHYIFYVITNAAKSIVYLIFHSLVKTVGLWARPIGYYTRIFHAAKSSLWKLQSWTIYLRSNASVISPIDKKVPRSVCILAFFCWFRHRSVFHKEPRCPFLLLLLTFIVHKKVNQVFLVHKGFETILHTTKWTWVSFLGTVPCISRVTNLVLVCFRAYGLRAYVFEPSGGGILVWLLKSTNRFARFWKRQYFIMLINNEQ